MGEDEVDGGDLDAQVAEAEQEAVFFRHAVEAPGVVGCSVGGKSEDALHPVTSPGAGVEEGHDAEGAIDDGGEAAAKDLAGDCFGLAGNVGVEQKIDFAEQTLLEPVGGAP